MYFQPDSADALPWEYADQFDLRFEGDRIWFARQYPYGILKLPSVQFHVEQSRQQAGHEREWHAVINPDSIVYKRLWTTPWVYPVYEGNADKLADKIRRRSYLYRHSRLQDSLLIFQGIVERDGRLTKVQQVFGDRTPYSDVVARWLESDDQRWRPAIQGGRPIRARAAVNILLI